MAKLQTLNREAGKVSEFLLACKLYIRIRMRVIVVEEQVQWVYCMCRESQQIFEKKM